jgi:hypothetical protein
MARYKSAALSAAPLSAAGSENHCCPPTAVQVVFNFPPVVGYPGLAELMGRSVQTLQSDRCRNPESVPPASTPPGCRTPLWVVGDVITWVRQHQTKIRELKSSASVPGRGASTKAERLAAMEAGLSVRQWRAAHTKMESCHVRKG